jgi:hypothetical protein
VSCACDSSAALATFELPYYRGDTAPIVASLLNPDGTAYVIDPATVITFQVLASDAATAALLWDKATGQGIATLDLAAGLVAITPTATESVAITTGVTYPAIMRITDQSGATVTMGKGYLLAL